MTQWRVTDEQIHRAFERRAHVGVPDDLRRLVVTSIAATPQRRRWQALAAEVLVRPHRRSAVPAVIAVLLLVATMVAIAIVGRAKPMPEGSQQRIAYISGGDLFVADPAGTFSRLVWDSPATEILSRPVWVDAETILVDLHRAADGVDLVYLVNIVSGAPRLVEYSSELLALSSDHRRIATAHGPQGANSRLHIVELAPGSIAWDLGPLESVTPLSWSPDDRWLLGQETRYGSGGLIYRYDIEARRSSDLATGLCCGVQFPGAALSPDGSRVAFADYHEAAQGELCDVWCGTLWSLDPATGARQQLTATEGSEIGPVFSPDGTSIAFMEYAASGYDLALVRADGTARRRLTRTGDALAPGANLKPFSYLSWDADGHGITLMRRPPGARVTNGELELWHVSLEDLMEQRLGTFTLAEFAR